MTEKTFTNRLIHETSPYLLQHAHNPVDWYPWGEVALQKAKAEDKPILVSIGYAACHWCHVMERESFEDEATADIMNRYFVNIKIDREERPDLDHIYMDALQALSGSGGWPLNVFLTPELKPFYGGTYFPPVKMYNRNSWKEVLLLIHEAYQERRHEIEAQADNLTQHIAASNSFGIKKPGEASTERVFTQEDLQQMANTLLAAADKTWGGFGRPPKFPQSFSISYLLRHYHFTGHQASLDHALLSLDKMTQGGMYDHLGGGYARYSTDEKWLAPHFEKMLYDNALLVQVLAEACQVTHLQQYAGTIAETMAFVQRELTAPGGGFYSALDADSEGVEGKFYTWSKAEIEAVLQEDGPLFCQVYDVTEQGNWEHSNILWLPENLSACAKQLQVQESELAARMEECKLRLLQVRNGRIRPLLDDKILLGWNALMLTACCKAYAATGVHAYLLMAEQNIAFLEKCLSSADGTWYHTWKNGQAKFPAFLDDYAALIQAYINLQEVTGNQEYLLKAKRLTEKVLADFGDEETPYCWYTPAGQPDIIVRKKEVYDGAVPSGNAMMAYNLLYLSMIFDIREWGERATRMVQLMDSAIIRYPSSFGVWAAVIQLLATGFVEIAITGSGAVEGSRKFIRHFMPNKILQSAVYSPGDFPLLNGKFDTGGKTQYFLCKNYACQAPVDSVNALVSRILEN